MTERTNWYLNLSYVCNERCTFCAAELAGGSLRIDGRPAIVSKADVERWLDGVSPRVQGFTEATVASDDWCNYADVWL